ncbi:UNVERIFIED_CONTAM: hypothetical protein HDU68_000053 [Siphonaria sp. JEL0065]|nr:hypothetical protein HDU68_000053 [Siphonaria sp. JEL0065]
MRDIIYYCEYSESIYGLPLHMITNWTNFKRALQVLCIPEWCLPNSEYHGRPQNVVENVRHHLGKPGWPFCCVQERAPKHRHADLLAISLENGFFRSPYMVCLDHGRKVVVVAVRGTMSTADGELRKKGFWDFILCVCLCDETDSFLIVLVDLNCDLEPLNIPQQAQDGTWLPPIKSKTHSGISQTAKHIKQEVTGLLESLVLDSESEYKDYGVVLCGHSLGAVSIDICFLFYIMSILTSIPKKGVAALLAHHLRTSTLLAPKIKCYCYSPPGCITTPRANTAHFSKFVTSVVLGDEVVPRLNRRRVERLKKLVKKGVASCNVRKVDVVGGFIGAECFGVNNRSVVDFDDMFGGGGATSVEGGAEGLDHVAIDIVDGSLRESLERAGIEDGMLVERESFDDGTGEEDEELQIPGRVVHFRKEKVPVAESQSRQQGEDEEVDEENDEEMERGSNSDLVHPTYGSGGGSPSSDQLKKVYRAVWSEPNYFHDIVISSTMVSEHMPHVMGNVLRRCALNSEGGSSQFVADVDFREWRT